jgi:4-amino-4-deoxy-L-arabinose transferase-like glycosyltransferase
LWLQILVISGIVLALTGWLGLIGLASEEPRRALISIEMFLTGNYRIPHLFGWLYFNKPPLFNWLQVIFISITGNYNEWIIRLPSILSLLFLAYINLKFVKQYAGHETALFSSLFLLTSGDILFFGSVYAGEIDLFFTLLVYLQAITFYHFLQTRQYTLMFVVSYLFTALGFLTKGLPAIAFQGITLVGVLLVFRQFRLLFSWKHIMGIVVFLLIGGGYLFLMYRENMLMEFIVRQLQESFQRTAAETTLLQTIRGFFVTPARIILMLLPWSLFIVYMLRKDFMRDIKSRSLIFFSFVFILVNLPLYWITGDFKGRYIYPFFPFFSILFGHFFTTHVQRIQTGSWLYFVTGAAFILLPIALTAVFFIPAFSNIPVNHILNIVLIVSAILLAFMFVRTEKYRIYLLLLLLVVARLAVNNIYLNSLAVDSRNAVYMQHVENILTITGGEQVYITGSPNQYPDSFTLGPFSLSVTSIQTAPYIAFQVPYYLTLHTGRLMKFEEDLTPGRFYLVTELFASGKAFDIKYSFHDGFIHSKWLLIQIPMDSSLQNDFLPVIK